MKSDTSLPVGTKLVSPDRTYTVVGVLGQGGFGITYLVESDIQLDNISTSVKLAVKEHFLKDLCTREMPDGTVSCFTHNSERVGNSRRAFVAEANRIKSVCRLHPNIVNVNEVFDANGTSYYVMEYVEGVSLREHVAKHGKCGFNDMMKLMRPVVDAVAVLHGKQINHLDINPNNIMVGANPGRRTILIDFGLAKHFDDTGNATSSLLLSGYSAGYAPLEQYGGISTFSPASDVYSLGATMFYCLTGNRPLPAMEISAEWIKSQMPSTVPGIVINTILRAMSPNKNDRFADASELARDMDNWDDGEILVDGVDAVADDKTDSVDDEKTEMVETIASMESNSGETTVIDTIDNPGGQAAMDRVNTKDSNVGRRDCIVEKQPIPQPLKKRLSIVALLAGLVILILPVFAEHGHGVNVFDAIDALNYHGNPLGVILCLVMPFVTAAFLHFKATRKSLPIALGMMGAPILIYGMTFPDDHSVNVGFGFMLDLLLTALFAFWCVREMKNKK